MNRFTPRNRRKTTRQMVSSTMRVYAPTPARFRTFAFSLVELLVVISIIALLISIALPSFRSARIAAKKVATKATITTIGSDLDTYRTEQSLGAVYPPSASPPTSGLNAGQIEDPYATTDDVLTYVTGASLLVYALAGPDNRGTVGFNGPEWPEHTGSFLNSGDLYDINANTPRYGPYAEGKLLEAIRPMAGNDLQGRAVGLIDKGIVRQTAMWPSMSGTVPPEARQRFFVDTFNRPILYYRARKSARFMVTDPSTAVPGVYDQRDNALLTGRYDQGGNDRGEGTVFVSTNKSHGLKNVLYDDVLNSGAGSLDPANPRFDSFIVDPSSVFGALRPVNPTTFLLISAGPDGLYGTKDDVKNWGK